MTIKVAIRHNTEYYYDRLVNLSPHVIRLRPAPHCRTPIKSYSLKVEPKAHFVNWQQDPFGNYLARYVFPDKTRSFKIAVEVIADMTVINPFDFFLEESAEHYPFKYEPELVRDLGPYLEIKEKGPLLMQWLKDVDQKKRPIIDFLVDLNQRLQGDIGYLIRMEPGVQTCEDTLQKQSGSCRDSAWLMVQILRHLGLAARFVSGYLVQLTADIKALDGPSGTDKDFTDLHAWVEVFIPGAGWVGLDPTSGLFAGEGHIPLACTPHPSSASPVNGSSTEAEVTFNFSNEVVRIYEDPRVTKPYSESQWQAIMSLGEKTDQILKKNDVRLTQGGEPTFVSIDDMDAAEWNTKAHGKQKRKLAVDLLLRLKQVYGKKGLLQFGQGKWYPGEPLPRWSLSIFWRKDGIPIWSDDNLLAREEDEYKFNTQDAFKFIAGIASATGVDKQLIVTGYEDVLFNMHQESRLPENLNPETNKLDNPTERARMVKLFREGLGNVVGYALPLKWQQTDEHDGFWKSSAWPFRNEYMYLLPGDSPMGYRLPLASLPWQLEVDKDIDVVPDPFAKRGKLPSTKKTKKTNKKSVEHEREVVHTAMCVQARDGKLYVFMPPVNLLERYLELISIVESVAKRLKMPVIIEGYEMPWDPRIQKLQITPDPGVIEVNIHPAPDWQQLSDNILTLYEEARQCRLGTEKFMLDGRHSGTGGGNHVTLGGATPADSPFLRRPQLLRSFVTYWQHHPALSYLFSGLFIGPTSQAPRVDEARDDNLYELEIAMSLLPEGDCEQPWLVDRIMRNFLVDLTGNTHRSEFCIDKLYAPDSPTGRLGLVEFRAFEMPPHAQMSIVQMLLLRSLVAHFWENPYQQNLIRWGTELHDRFMLPHFVWEDLKVVVDDLNDAGFPFKLEWFAPFKEFRFPHIGTIHVEGMQLDLHTALEPWHVLGEESSGQGTARYVDSSVERIQVSVYGMAGDRYIVTCNGRKVPLRSTGMRGEYVAGVRYKAWQPYSSLHPTIKAQQILTFDIVDTYNSRSIGGCTYHVTHPGGRNYNTFPVNANEAEARRNARFFATGHTQGDMKIFMEHPHDEQPLTLDLRTALS